MQCFTQQRARPTEALNLATSGKIFDILTILQAHFKDGDYGIPTVNAFSACITGMGGRSIL